ncbi:MAG: signal peptidase I [Anaerolineae bacterium]|nr:signal peptidase I [Anaerolineae bacterium]
MSRGDTISSLDQPSQDPEAPDSTTGGFVRRAILETLGTIVPAILIALFVNVFVAQAMVIQGPSMQPNLYYDERVLIDKITYHFLHGPRRGDIVVVNVPGEEIPLIKRVVALPGEAIEVRNGQVLINDRPLEEPWPIQAGGPSYGPELVPPLHVFVLGDNRANSRDSRILGPIAIDQIIGKARLIYWPPEESAVLRSQIGD